MCLEWLTIYWFSPCWICSFEPAFQHFGTFTLPACVEPMSVKTARRQLKVKQKVKISATNESDRIRRPGLSLSVIFSLWLYPIQNVYFVLFLRIFPKKVNSYYVVCLFHNFSIQKLLSVHSLVFSPLVHKQRDIQQGRQDCRGRHCGRTPILTSWPHHTTRKQILCFEIN